MLGLFPEENVSTDLDLAGGGGGVQPCLFLLLPRGGRSRRVPWHLLRLNRYRRGPGAKNSWFQWLFCRHGGLLRALQLLDRLPRYGRTGGKIWPKWPGGQCQVIFQVIGGSLVRWWGGEVVGWLGDHSGGEEVRRAGGRLVILPRKPDDLHYCASQHSLQITHEIDAWCFQDSCWCSHNQVLWAEQMHFECGPRYAEESFCQVSNLLCQYIV